MKTTKHSRDRIEIIERKYDSSVILCVNGNLDGITSSYFESILCDFFEWQTVLLDLTNTGFISSSGLRSIIIFEKKFLGEFFGVYGANKLVQNVFDTSGIGEIINVIPPESLGFILKDIK